MREGTLTLETKKTIGRYSVIRGMIRLNGKGCCMTALPHSGCYAIMAYVLRMFRRIQVRRRKKNEFLTVTLQKWGRKRSIRFFLDMV